MTNLVLEGYAFAVCTGAPFPESYIFVDDGVSGVTYDRSGFQAMLAEIEAEVALFLGHGV